MKALESQAQLHIIPATRCSAISIRLRCGGTAEDLKGVCRIGKSLRQPLSEITKTPGPGSYVHKPTLGEGPKYGMRSKTPADLRHNGPCPGPGPGQYSPGNETERQAPRPSIGKGPRTDRGGEERLVPGPGAYSVGEPPKRQPSYTFGVSRSKLKMNEVPGPGTYRVPTTFAHNPRYALATHREEFMFV